MTNANEPTTYERLAAQFELADHARVKKGGFEQTYAPWTSYVDRMNTELGVENWSFRIVREGFTATECWVLAEVEAVIDGERVVRQQYGCEPIVKAGGTATGDLLKATASDAIKKAISLFGPGFYLSIKEERELIDAAMREAVRAEAARLRGEAPEDDRETPPAGRQGYGAAPAPIRPQAAPQAPPEPLTASDRAGLENKYEALREQALARGFQASWKGQGSAAWNDAQLPKYVELLEKFLARTSRQGAA